LHTRHCGSGGSGAASLSCAAAGSALCICAWPSGIWPRAVSPLGVLLASPMCQADREGSGRRRCVMVVGACDHSVARVHRVPLWFRQYALMCSTGASVALVPRSRRSRVVVVVVAVAYVVVASRRERRVVRTSIPCHALTCDVGPLLSSKDRGRGRSWHPRLVVVTAHSCNCDRWSLVARVSPRFGIVHFCATLGRWSWWGQRRGVQLAPPVHCVVARDCDCDCCGGGWHVWRASADPASCASVRCRSVAQWRQRWEAQWAPQVVSVLPRAIAIMAAGVCGTRVPNPHHALLCDTRV
jgi:hypothetical protein